MINYLFTSPSLNCTVDVSRIKLSCRYNKMFSFSNTQIRHKTIVNLGYLLFGEGGLPYKKDCGVLVGDFSDPLR